MGYVATGNLSGIWSPTWTGYSTPPDIGTGAATYLLIGKLCNSVYTGSIAGTSNATTQTITLPFVAARAASCICRIENNGVYASTGLLVTTAGSNIASIFRDGAATAYTASGSKNAQFTFTYEII